MWCGLCFLLWVDSLSSGFPALTLILPSALKGNSRKSVCDILYNPVPIGKEWLVTPARIENRSQHMGSVHAYSLYRMPRVRVGVTRS
jgi:hypothetical protein